MLNYPNKDNLSDESLNLKKLIKEYKPYFGLLMSKLYSLEETTASFSLRMRAHPKSVLGILLTHKVNANLVPSEKLTIYNSGSKLNTLLLNCINKEFNILQLASPNLKRSLHLSWQSLADTEIKERMKVPDLLSSKPKLNDHFRKYSELRITPFELTKYKQEYEQLNNSPR